MLTPCALCDDSTTLLACQLSEKAQNSKQARHLDIVYELTHLKDRYTSIGKKISNSQDLT